MRPMQASASALSHGRCGFGLPSKLAGRTFLALHACTVGHGWHSSGAHVQRLYLPGASQCLPIALALRHAPLTAQRVLLLLLLQLETVYLVPGLGPPDDGLAHPHAASFADAVSLLELFTSDSMFRSLLPTATVTPCPLCCGALWKAAEGAGLSAP